MKKYLAASLVVFVWFLVWDNFLASLVAGSLYSSIPGMVAAPSKLWETVGDLASALVIVGLYARTRTVFGEHVKGGAVYGVYAGVLANFPTWLNFTNYFGWPYKSAWIFTIFAIGLFAVAGAVAGMVYQSMAGAKSA